ncbi:MAG TPA: hypothetical protein VK589_16525 [Chryseolinea sp.]|nr:hypothetical protein [Chryseolinea sp.]
MRSDGFGLVQMSIPMPRKNRQEAREWSYGNIRMSGKEKNRS